MPEPELQGAEAPFDRARFLRTLTTQSGVYLMLGDKGRVLYVGKARNLKRRVASYFQKQRHSPKTLALLTQVDRVEVVVTHTETEALVLEANLIKRHQPPYNILLRDDKSYPYLLVETGHSFPRVAFHRGAQKVKGRYFGPYPAAGALRESIVLLQKAFHLRTCEESTFAHRSRACLQYQIKRCSGPCVGHIGTEDYDADVRSAIGFLEGRSSQVIEALGRRMQAAGERLDFEMAARLRDQIAALSKIQERQYVAQAGGGDFDVIALAREGRVACLFVSFIRKGRHLGGKALFPRHCEDERDGDVLAAFLMQFYLNKEIPGNILLNAMPTQATWLAESLAGQGGRRVQLSVPTRGPRRRWLDMALTNARMALRQRAQEGSGEQARFRALRELFDLPDTAARVECFDISHHRGEATLASCVVFGPEGPMKAEYRRYNIRGGAPGDDYGAMRQALRRRYERLGSEKAAMPDLVLIDGGRGQLAVAQEVVADLGIDGIQLCGVAKGPSRRPGLEELWLPEAPQPLRLAPDDPALLAIQAVRDEAHRFAITGQRARLARRRRESALDEVDGVGPKRRQALLKAFGGLRGIEDAGVDDLARVSGIDHNLAQRIYDHFHAARP